MKELKRILNTENYTLIYFDPDIIFHGVLEDNLYVYQDVAEEFAQSFFSKDIMTRKYNLKKDLTEVKHWIVGILYHFRKNSMSNIMSLTGYSSCGSIHEVISNFGKLRGFKESTDLAFQKRYGKSQSQYMSDAMKKVWEIRNGPFRDTISKTASDAMKKLWVKEGYFTKLYEKKKRKRAKLELKVILEKKKVSTSDLADTIKVSDSTVLKDLERLEKDGLINVIVKSKFIREIDGRIKGRTKPEYEVTKKGLEFISQTN